MRLLLAAAFAALAAGTASAGTPAAGSPSLACLAEAVYHESRGRGDRAAQAVAHVVLNRRESGDFPATVCGVVRDGCQFSYRCVDKPVALSEPRERGRAFRVAEAALAGDSRDPTGGALFFHAEGIDPGWFATRDRTAAIGGNVFYR